MNGITTGARDQRIGSKIAALFPPSARKHVQETVTRLMGEMQRDGITNPQQQADVLGQTDLETTMGLNLLEPRAAGKGYENRTDLGNSQKGDGVRFRGRGFVQITGRSSYTYWSKRLGIDLIKRPDLAANPAIAAKIGVLGMRDGTFTGMTSGGDLIAGGGKKLADYTDKHGNVDFYNSREIVNGHDKASTLLAKAREYLEIIRKTK